jgi:hypothetical protein
MKEIGTVEKSAQVRWFCDKKTRVQDKQNANHVHTK